MQQERRHRHISCLATYRLSKVERPRDLEFRSEALPKTRIGKPSKLTLRQEDRERMDRGIEKTA